MTTREPQRPVPTLLSGGSFDCATVMPVPKLRSGNGATVSNRRVSIPRPERISNGDS
jgi:hypothetical protein